MAINAIGVLPDSDYMDKYNIHRSVKFMKPVT